MSDFPASDAVGPETEPAATPTEPDARRRAIRTAIQVAVAVLVSIPAAWGALAAAGVDIPAPVTAWVIGIPGTLTVLISAGQNAYDARHTT